MKNIRMVWSVHYEDTVFESLNLHINFAHFVNYEVLILQHISNSFVRN